MTALTKCDVCGDVSETTGRRQLFAPVNGAGNESAATIDICRKCYSSLAHRFHLVGSSSDYFDHTSVITGALRLAVLGLGKAP